MTLATHYPKGVDKAGLLITMRRSRTGPGLPSLFAALCSPSPVPTSLRSRLLTCAFAATLFCCTVAGLHDAAAAAAQHAPWRDVHKRLDSNARRSRSRHCRQRSRSAISLGTHLAGERLSRPGLVTGRTADWASHSPQLLLVVDTGRRVNVRAMRPATCSSSPASVTSASTSGTGEW